VRCARACLLRSKLYKKTPTTAELSCAVLRGRAHCAQLPHLPLRARAAALHTQRVAPPAFCVMASEPCGEMDAAAALAFFDERVRWQVSQFQGALEDVECVNAALPVALRDTCETADSYPNHVRFPRFAALRHRVVMGIPFYTERDNVVSQLVTLRQARLRGAAAHTRAEPCHEACHNVLLPTCRASRFSRARHTSAGVPGAPAARTHRRHWRDEPLRLRGGHCGG
jgi:hypothetical protein